MKYMCSHLAKGAIIAAIFTNSTPSQAFFFTGNGQYSLRGITNTKPSFDKNDRSYQAIEQSFRLNGEFRSSDRMSFFLETRIFDNERSAYMGDKTGLVNCGKPTDDPMPNLGSSYDCEGKHQSSIEPRYKPYIPQITKAYVKYATDYCLVTAGRRPREWGLGMYLDAGNDPFDTDWSVYDGVTCAINLQKTQTLGFSVGYDKITESGASIFMSGDDDFYGASENRDDLDQLYLTLEYNDDPQNTGRDFSQQIGIYFANILGGSNSSTDIKIADLFINLNLKDFVVKQEILFRLGETAEPNAARLGGVYSRASTSGDEAREKNDVQSIAAAGSFEYFISRSGNVVGPAKYQAGTAKSHSLFFDYAYAPGDADGYYPVYSQDPGEPSPRDKNAQAVAFHRNFKPALIFFNAPPESDQLRIDGAFDPFRLMNVTMYSLGYRYQSLQNGNFEVKLISGQLNESIPEDAKSMYQAKDRKPIGYSGTDLGWELDLAYNKNFGASFDVGVEAAVALPGDAWKQRESQDTENSYLVQTYASFFF